MDHFLSHDWAGMLIALVVGLVGWGLVALGRRILNERRVVCLLIKSAGFVVLGLAILLELGAIYHVVAVARRSAQYPPPGQMVDVGGYEMHIVAEGENNGNPTIIWIPGAHDQGLMLHHLHTAIAAETRSIIYDRAATGWSDIGPYPRTVDRECEELRALLEGAAEKGPFIVAGHSFGGLLAANFAHHSPDLVAGVLLMDSTPPWNMTFAASTIEGLNSYIRFITMATLFGQEWLYPDPIDPAWAAFPDYEGEVVGAIRANDLRARYWRSFGSALRAPIENPFSMVLGAGALGDVPLFLLTPRLDKDEFRKQTSEGGFGFSDIEFENFFDGLVHGNQQQTALSTVGEHHLTPEGTGHHFMYEDPDYALGKLRELMGRIRALSGTGSKDAEKRPRILVTNDDGYSTPGIAALAEAMAEFADVVVVAPLENASGSSQSIRVFSNPEGIRLREVPVGQNLTGYAVDGTPADCVWIGIQLFGEEEPFDFVVSGTNHGANIGPAFLYSGTVGAAYQASSQGIPAIAVSQDHRRADHTTAAEFAAKVVKRLLEQPLQDGVVLSINVPDGEIRGVVAEPPGANPLWIEMVPAGKRSGDPVYKAEFTERDEIEPTHDVRGFMDGYITVTPLQLDRTHRPTLDIVAGWNFVDGSSR